MENRPEQKQDLAAPSADADPTAERPLAAGTPDPEPPSDTLDDKPAGKKKKHDALISTLAAGAESDGEPSYDEALAAEAPPPELVADRYRIKKRIGSGGFGVVYRAIDERLQKAVAIKVLGASRAKNKNALERFRVEALAAGRINHPGIVAVTDFAQLPDGRPYLVMELVSGETLFDLIKRDGKVSVPRAARLARLICQALDAAHHEGIIHRDLKPANVIVRDDPRASDPTVVKILDFGIAKLAEARRREHATQSGQVLGTPAYIAPEQIRESSTIDGRADLYSVGVILYELVTGELPFKTRDAANLLVSKVVDAPESPTKHVPDLPPAFVKLLMRSIDRDPDVRPKTCDELAAALEPFLDAGAPAPRRRPRWIIPGLFVVAAELAFAIWVWTSRGEDKPTPPPPPPPAPVLAPVVVDAAPPPPPPILEVEPPPPPAPDAAPAPPPKVPIKRKPQPPPGSTALPDEPLAPRAR
jgi:serine/threonine-protein kinase